MDNLTKQILTTVAEGYDSARPGLGDCIREKIAAEEPEREFSIQELALIREAILTVIDGGPKGRERWGFYEDHEYNTEAEANEDRLDFCGAVQDYLVDRLAPALKGKGA